MKSVRVIFLLFYFLMCNAYSYNLEKPTIDESRSVNVNLYPPYNNAQLIKENLQDSIKKLEQLISRSNILYEKDNKILAINYAKLGEADKANEYLSKYIKQSYDIGILNLEAFDKIKNSVGFINLKKKYQPELNIWIIFLFASGLIGVFIAVMLNLRKQGDLMANLLISSFVVLHSLFIIHLGLFFSKLNFSVPHSLYASTSFSLLYGPLIYFYFRRISEKYTFKWIDFLHLIPTLGLILFFIPIYLKTTNEKLHLLYNRDEALHHILTTVTILKGISLIIYGFLIFKIYKKNKHENQYPEVKKWKQNLIFLNSLYVFSYIIYGVALISIVMDQFLIYPQAIFMGLIILYVSYVAYVQPKIFSKEYLFERIALKYKKSGLTEKYSVELKEQLIVLLEKEKVYRVNDLSLNSLSEIIGTSRHNLSQVINEHFNLNFFSLLNKYRIKEAQDILLKDVNRNLNIIDVAYEVGFNNKVTFNKAFKEITDQTPSQFLKNYKDKGLSVEYKF